MTLGIVVNGCQMRVSVAICRCTRLAFCLVELSGLEPLTPCLQSKCSSN
jgi:hypothetical protein